MPCLAYIALLFIGGSVRVPASPPIEFALGPDKIVHALAFALLVPFAVRAIRWLWPQWRPTYWIHAAGVFSIAMGGLLELYQAALPHRSAEWADFIADGIGAVVAGVLILMRVRWRQRT